MSTKGILKKLNDVMNDLEAVGKNSTNSAQGFKFRGIDQMLNTFKPLFTKHKVVMTFDVIQFNQELKEVTRSNGRAGIDKHVSMLVKYTFHDADTGDSVTSTVAAEGLDNGDKATTKALSMGLKYCLIQTLTVPTEDIDDGDSDSPVIESSAKSVKSEPAKSPEQDSNQVAKPKFERNNTNRWSNK